MVPLPCLIIIRFHLYTKLGRGRGCPNGDVFQVSSPLVCLSQLEYFHINLQCSSLGISFAILPQRQPLLKMYTLLPYPTEDSHRIFMYLAFFSTKVSALPRSQTLSSGTMPALTWTPVYEGLYSVLWAKSLSSCEAMALFDTLSSFTFLFTLEAGKPTRFDPQ